MRRFAVKSFNSSPLTARTFSATALRERLEVLVPEHQEKVKKLNKEFGHVSLGEVTVGMAIGGMRGIKGMLCETSVLDAEEGIRFRGYTIPELQEKLPSAPGGEEPLPEGLFWLLLTGEIPTEEQVRGLSRDLCGERSKLSEECIKMLSNLPPTMHPMTQLSSAVLFLQQESEFYPAYERGEHKKNFWKFYLEDSLNLVAKLPEVAARIYRNSFHDGDLSRGLAQLSDSDDWAQKYAKLMQVDSSPEFTELMRLYMTIHSDHEGGNVSAHTTHLVGSALSDAYQSTAAGLCGLAGPLHGLANQEVLRWIMQFRAKYGESITKSQLVDALWDTLNSGQVIPGYGHAVLRKTDPRYTCQREFALKHLPEDPLFKLVSDMYEVVPGILTEHGKTKNPWPNVDAHSGVLLYHYGLTEANYYTVMFGISRALGVLPSLVISRYLGLPIERPKSMDSEGILKLVQSKK